MDKLYTIEIGIEEPWIGIDDTFEIQYEFTEDELSEIILGGIRLIHSESMDIGTYEFIEVLSKSAFSKLNTIAERVAKERWGDKSLLLMGQDTYISFLMIL